MLRTFFAVGIIVISATIAHTTDVSDTVNEVIEKSQRFADDTGDIMDLAVELVCENPKASVACLVGTCLGPISTALSCTDIIATSCGWSIGLGIPFDALALASVIYLGFKTTGKNQELTIRNKKTDERWHVAEIIRSAFKFETSERHNRNFGSKGAKPIVDMLSDYSKIDSSHQIKSWRLAKMIRHATMAGYFISPSAIDIAIIGGEGENIGKWKNFSVEQIMAALAHSTKGEAYDAFLDEAERNKQFLMMKLKERNETRKCINTFSESI